MSSCQERLHDRRWQYLDIDGKLEEVSELVGRAQRNVQEAAQLTVAVAPATFSRL